MRRRWPDLSQHVPCRVPWRESGQLRLMQPKERHWDQTEDGEQHRHSAQRHHGRNMPAAIWQLQQLLSSGRPCCVYHARVLSAQQVLRSMCPAAGRKRGSLLLQARASASERCVHWVVNPSAGILHARRWRGIEGARSSMPRCPPAVPLDCSMLARTDAAVPATHQAHLQ